MAEDEFDKFFNQKMDELCDKFNQIIIDEFSIEFRKKFSIYSKVNISFELK